MLSCFFRRRRAGFLAFALSTALYACSGSSERNSVDWGGVNYAEIICAMPDSGCLGAAEQERQEEYRGHRSRGGKR